MLTLYQELAYTGSIHWEIYGLSTQVGEWMRGGMRKPFSGLLTAIKNEKRVKKEKKLNKKEKRKEKKNKEWQIKK